MHRPNFLLRARKVDDHPCPFTKFALNEYLAAHPLDKCQEIAAAQRRSWFVVGTVTLVIYLLAGFVRRASDTIEGQQATLNDQISRLTELLGQNQELHERVRRAAG